MKPRSLTIEHLWVLGALGTCFAYACTLPMEQTDSWHHIKAGEFMAHSHQILKQDLFTFTIPNKAYVNMHWGSQIIYYLLYHMGGIPFLVFVHALFIMMAFILLFRILWNRSKNLRVASVVTFITCFLSAPNFDLRPEGFSILFFAMTLYLLENKRLWAIPPLFIIWSNVHGAFILGLILVGLEWLGSLKLGAGLDKFEEEKWKPPERSALFVTLVIAFLATLITPWGFRLYLALFENEAVSRISQIVEWDPPSLHQLSGALFFSALLLISLLNGSKRHWNRKDLLTFIVFTVLALRQQRAIIWWAIATAPLLLVMIKNMSFVRNYKPTQPSNLWIANGVLLLFFSIYLVSCLPWIKTNNTFIPDTKRPLITPNTPVEIAKQLKNIPDAHRIFNNFVWGSYFIWALRNDQKVFYDPRVFIFPETVIQDYLLINSGYAAWQSLLDRHQVDTLALSKDEQKLLIPLVRASRQWKPVYETAQGIIFVKPNSTIPARAESFP